MDTVENHDKSKFNDKLRERIFWMAAICIVQDVCDKTLFWLDYQMHINIFMLIKIRKSILKLNNW
jgi:hypothetical protein